jgi:hypothetical protein
MDFPLRLSRKELNSVDIFLSPRKIHVGFLN